MKKEINNKINRLKSMIKSCFTYGGLNKNDYTHKRYIQPLINDLGEDVGNKIYNEYKALLEETYNVEPCVFTDNEGCTYNSLVEKTF